MGRWQYRNRAYQHHLAREAAIATFSDGQLCALCSHPMHYGEKLELDHADDGTYRGLVHASPCRTCHRRCNPSAGGIKAALAAGKQLRNRRCVVCGKPYRAGRGTSGATQATCGAQPCINELRRRRRDHEPDGEPPAESAEVW